MDGTGVRTGIHFLLACHTRCKCSMETICFTGKAKLGIMVLKLVKSLIGWTVTVTGRASECHSTFVRGRFRIAEKYCY